MRSRAANDSDRVVERTVEWQPAKTALVICDMWDDHWCKGAARRVVELAVPVNKLAHQARDAGMLVIHCPSTCVDFYKDTPQRRRAQSAPYAKPPVPLSSDTRWGTHWCYPDPQREPALPIDDSDMGCDCATKCEIASPWKRQIAAIDIAEPDAISDDGQEVFNLLAERGIDRVLIAGVHLNMCVLGRSFAIRQMVALDKQVMLVRDLTDTMYCSRMKPFVNHFRGTDLVVEHVEALLVPHDHQQRSGGRFAVPLPRGHAQQVMAQSRFRTRPTNPKRKRGDEPRDGSLACASG